MSGQNNWVSQQLQKGVAAAGGYVGGAIHGAGNGVNGVGKGVSNTYDQILYLHVHYEELTSTSVSQTQRATGVKASLVMATISRMPRTQRVHV